MILRAAALAWTLPLAATLASVAAAGEDPMADLERLGRALRAQPVWSCAFEQEYVMAGMTGGDEEVGEVWVAWPDRTLFVSGEPPLRLTGLLERQLRLVDLEVGTCDDHRLGDDEWARLPLAAVLDPARAVDSFTVLPGAGDGFVLVPREEGGLARLEVALGSDDLPRRVVILDVQGNTNRLTLGPWTAHAEPPDGGWLPPPPEGVECAEDLR